MASLLAKRPGVKIGDQFRRLTVAGPPFYIRYDFGDRRQVVVCDCECGRVCVTNIKSLKNGDTKSCGCWNDECLRKVVHGHKRRNDNGGAHPLYIIWCEFRRRCRSKTHKRYADYGGRGITVCQLWDSNYQAFYDWAMTHGYQQGLTIDRRNNNGPYSPDNCRFVTYAVNNSNKRKYKRHRRPSTIN